MGRKKIKIAYIAQDRVRKVTFAKRMYGVMKKAYEISELCKCNLSLILINDENRIFEFSTMETQKFMEYYNKLVSEGVVPERRDAANILGLASSMEDSDIDVRMRSTSMTTNSSSSTSASGFSTMSHMTSSESPRNAKVPGGRHDVFEGFMPATSGPHVMGGSGAFNQLGYIPEEMYGETETVDMSRHHQLVANQYIPRPGQHQNMHQSHHPQDQSLSIHPSMQHIHSMRLQASAHYEQTINLSPYDQDAFSNTTVAAEPNSNAEMYRLPHFRQGSSQVMHNVPLDHLVNPHGAYYYNDHGQGPPTGRSTIGNIIDVMPSPQGRFENATGDASGCAAVQSPGSHNFFSQQSSAAGTGGPAGPNCNNNYNRSSGELNNGSSRAGSLRGQLKTSSDLKNSGGRAGDRDLTKIAEANHTLAENTRPGQNCESLAAASAAAHGGMQSGALAASLQSAQQQQQQQQGLASFSYYPISAHDLIADSGRKDGEHGVSAYFDTGRHLDPVQSTPMAQLHPSAISTTIGTHPSTPSLYQQLSIPYFMQGTPLSIQQQSLSGEPLHQHQHQNQSSLGSKKAFDPSFSSSPRFAGSSGQATASSENSAKSADVSFQYRQSYVNFESVDMIGPNGAAATAPSSQDTAQHGHKSDKRPAGAAVMSSEIYQNESCAEREANIHQRSPTARVSNWPRALRIEEPLENDTAIMNDLNFRSSGVLHSSEGLQIRAVDDRFSDLQAQKMSHRGPQSIQDFIAQQQILSSRLANSDTNKGFNALSVCAVDGSEDIIYTQNPSAITMESNTGFPVKKIAESSKEDKLPSAGFHGFRNGSLKAEQLAGLEVEFSLPKTSGDCLEAESEDATSQNCRGSPGSLTVRKETGDGQTRS